MAFRVSGLKNSAAKYLVSHKAHQGSPLQIHKRGAGSTKEENERERYCISYLRRSPRSVSETSAVTVGHQPRCEALGGRISLGRGRGKLGSSTQL